MRKSIFDRISPKKRNPAGKIVFVIGSGLICLLMLAVMELNQNTVLGLILTVLLAAAFWIVHKKILLEKRWYFKLLGWAGWLILFSAILILTWPPVRAVPAVSGDHLQTTEVVSTRDGDVQGVLTQDGEVEVFAGIPYAKPPVGDLRWREPEDPDPWEGVLAADHFGPMSMQTVNPPIYRSLRQIIGFHDYRISWDDNWIPPVSEDSLYLNIWKPEGKQKDLPVLVYIHGGSLQTGQPWFADYSGEGLAREDVIVVNMAYRLGVFGYFADEELAEESENGSTGNYGLLDQIKALEWVQENIASFGGDPGNVTIAGESAGSASVSALCTSPLAKGLFRRAILESSTLTPVNPPHSFRTMEEALESGRQLKQRYEADSVDDLRALSAEAIVDEMNTQHHITIDGYALEETPYESYQNGRYNEEEILHGYNSLESAAFIIFDQADLNNYEQKVRDYFGPYSDEIFGLYPAATNEEARRNWAEIWGAVFFDYPHYCLNRLAVKNGIPVYEYYFSKENGRLGPWHSGELIYCYRNIPDGSSLFDARDRELSEEMAGYWKNFISSGDPNGKDLPQWEMNQSSDRMMGFGETTEMIQETKIELFSVLDKMDLWEDDN